MKKILLIAILMVTSIFAYTQTELKKNYELCLDFTGEVDPKNPQINFYDCDKWIDLYENPELAKNAVKADGTIDLNNVSSGYGFYYKMWEQGQYKKAQETFIKKTDGKTDKFYYLESSVYLTDLYTFTAEKEFNKREEDILGFEFMINSSGIHKAAMGNALSNLVQMCVSEGSLPSSFNISQKDIKNARNNHMTFNIDTVGLLNRYIEFFTEKESIDDFVKRSMLINAFLMYKYKVRDSLNDSYHDKELSAMYQLILKGNDADTITFLGLIANEKYNEAEIFLYSISGVKRIYDGIKDRDRIVTLFSKSYCTVNPPRKFHDTSNICY